jgi:hypothetical protein
MFKEKDLISKDLTKFIDKDCFFDMIRAFDFPGHKPAYVNLKDKKVELVAYKRDRFKKRILISNNELFTC